MEEKDVSGFKLACKNYFFSLDLNSLRTYGRALQLKSPTAMKKADLIEEIIKALCGESRPQRNKKGAPIKNDYLDKRILESVARLQKEYLYKEEMERAGENQEIKPAFAQSMKEGGLEPLQFTVRFSHLNEKQKNLFIAFLNSL